MFYDNIVSLRNEVIKFDITNEIRIKMVKLALLQHKKKYEWTKRGPEQFDCAGLTWFLYNEIMSLDINKDGYGLSTTTKQMTSPIGTFIKYEEKDLLNFIDMGDILFFHRQSLKDNKPTPLNFYPGHCGIYLGDYKFIHASRVKGEVVISDFTLNNYWLDVLVGSKSIISNIQLEKRHVNGK